MDGWTKEKTSHLNCHWSCVHYSLYLLNDSLSVNLILQFLADLCKTLRLLPRLSSTHGHLIGS